MEQKLQIIGMYQFKQKRYVSIGFEGKWKDSYGDADEGFLAEFYGDTGSAKTEAAVQLANYVEQFGKVLYISYEQKDRSTIRTSFERNGLLEKNHRVFLSPGGSYEAIEKYLCTTKGIRFVFIDSVDYTKMDIDDVKRLRERFWRVSFIYVAHGKGNSPKRALAEDILFDCDIKIHVKKGVAFFETRFKDGGDPFIVYEKRARQFHPYLFTEGAEIPVRKVKPPKKSKPIPKQLMPSKAKEDQ